MNKARTSSDVELLPSCVVVAAVLHCSSTRSSSSGGLAAAWRSFAGAWLPRVPI